MAETGQTWRITYEGQATGKKDGAFHLHVRAGTTDLDDSWRLAPPTAGGPSQSWLKGALSVTGHGRIEDLVQDGGRQAVPALSVRGTLADTLGYEVRVDERDAKLVRGQFEGTDLRRDFRAGDAIYLNGHVDIIARVEQDGEAAGKRLYLTHGVPPEKMPKSGVKPQRDSDLLVVHNGAGEPKVVVDRSGQVTATSFAGVLEAQHLQGTLALERLPNLPASQITDGVLEVGRIPPLDAAKLTSGTLALERLPNLPASKITGLQATLNGKVNSAGVDNLCIMGGTVASNGAIKGGKGFQVKREDTGLYMITFDRGFSATPSASVTQVFSTEGDLRRAGESGSGGDIRDNAVIVGIDEGQMKVKTGSAYGEVYDRSFTFVVIGPW